MTTTDAQRKAVVALIGSATGDDQPAVDRKVAEVIGPNTTRVYCKETQTDTSCAGATAYRVKLIITWNDGSQQTVYGNWSCTNPPFPMC